MKIDYSTIKENERWSLEEGKITISSKEQSRESLKKVFIVMAKDIGQKTVESTQDFSHLFRLRESVEQRCPQHRRADFLTHLTALKTVFVHKVEVLKSIYNKLYETFFQTTPEESFSTNQFEDLQTLFHLLNDRSVSRGQLRQNREWMEKRFPPLETSPLFFSRMREYGMPAASAYEFDSDSTLPKSLTCQAAVELALQRGKDLLHSDFRAAWQIFQADIASHVISHAQVANWDALAFLAESLSKQCDAKQLEFAIGFIEEQELPTICLTLASQRVHPVEMAKLALRRGESPEEIVALLQQIDESFLTQMQQMDLQSMKDFCKSLTSLPLDKQKLDEINFYLNHLFAPEEQVDILFKIPMDESIRADLLQRRGEKSPMAATQQVEESLLPQKKKTLPDTLLFRLSGKERDTVEKLIDCEEGLLASLESFASDPELLQVALSSVEERLKEIEREKQTELASTLFSNQLSDQFTLDKCPDDGDCFFHALGRGIGQSMREVRREVGQFMVENQISLLEQEDPVLLSLFETVEELQMQAFLTAEKAESREGWGTLAHAKLFCWAYQVPVVIHSHLEEAIYFDRDREGNSLQGEAIHLLYNGTNHWDRMVAKR